MAVNQFNLAQYQRAERKLLITVAEWTDTPQDIYTLQAEQPADWSTNYTSYYTKSGSTYTAVPEGTGAPTWAHDTYYTKTSVSIFREILGRRTEDSSLEYNADIETTTDILGINYTDINKTQPQQDFDPYLILGGSLLGAKLNDIRKRNALSELNQFTVYVITAYIGDATNGYEAEKHVNCTITYNSLGGDTKVNMPISVYLSNDSVIGTVDKLSDDFTFTQSLSI